MATPSVFDVLGTGPSALSLREFLRCDEAALRSGKGMGMVGDTESAADFLRGLETMRSEALEEVREAHQALAAAKVRYERAVLTAHEYGCTNTMIAEQAKMTETAIRLFLKRRRMKAAQK